MKKINIILFVILLCSFWSQVVQGQETIELSQYLLGTFSSGDTECYELAIEEAGEYVIT